jgi:surface polysaccharide O-acyltransferase-like enzyme
LVSDRAARTPASRERYVDLLRALAIIVVVLGHWLLTVIARDADGRLTGYSALETIRWMYPLTWLFQVMPIFFLAGGYANAASWSAYRRGRGSAAAWLLTRATRLLRPTTVLLALLAAGAVIAQRVGASGEVTRLAVWFATIQLWFLPVYLGHVALTPVMSWLHRRLSWRIVVALVVLVGLGDLARVTGHGYLGDGNDLFGWLVMYQIGLIWYARRPRLTPRVWAPLLVGGLAMLMVLTLAGPYPVTMVDVAGQGLHNASPPTLALLATAAFQFGLVGMFHGPASQWLRRERPWRAVVGLNAVILTVFLWHMVAVLPVVGLLLVLRALPTAAAGTASWWLWRLPWFALLLLVLAVLVALAGQVEIRGTRARAGHRRARRLSVAITPPVRLALVLVAYSAVITALVGNNFTPADLPSTLAMPLWAVITYLAGAGSLSLLHAMPDTRAGPANPPVGPPTAAREELPPPASGQDADVTT